MRVEEEWSDTKTDDGDPEVDQMGDPDAHGDIQQKDERPHTEVDRGAREPGAAFMSEKTGCMLLYALQDAKRDTRRSETSTRRNIPCTAKG